jgi:hypothetical protein
MTVIGRASLCRWCSTPIIRDRDGQWIHTGLAYSCRDPWGGWLPNTAAPRPALNQPAT